MGELPHPRHSSPPTSARRRHPPTTLHRNRLHRRLPLYLPRRSFRGHARRPVLAGSEQTREANQPRKTRPLQSRPFCFNRWAERVGQSSARGSLPPSSSALRRSGTCFARLAPPRITGYVQITHEGHLKFPAGTDGSRLYFNVNAQDQPVFHRFENMSGGEIARIPIALPNPYLQDISPDGSTLLVSSRDGDAYSLWTCHLPGGTLRHLADASAQRQHGLRMVPR